MIQMQNDKTVSQEIDEYLSTKDINVIYMETVMRSKHHHTHQSINPTNHHQNEIVAAAINSNKNSNLINSNAVENQNCDDDDDSKNSNELTKCFERTLNALEFVLEVFIF